MIKNLLLFALLSIVSASTASGEARITFLIKTSYPSEIKLSQRPKLVKPKVVWRQPVGASTTLTVSIDPADVETYIIQDANAITTIWTRLEDGDSLVYAIDLDSGTFALKYDKHGYLRRAEYIEQRYAHYLKRLDSAVRVLPFNTYQRHGRLLQDEFQRETRQAIDSLAPSKRHALLSARAASFATTAVLRYLRTGWSESTKTSLCGKKLSYTSLVGHGQTHDDVFASGVSEWIDVLYMQANACNLRTDLDSLAIDLLTLFSGRRLGLAYTMYSARKMAAQNDEEVTRDLLRRMPQFISDSDLVRDYTAMIAERLSLSPGSIAPEIELPDSNGVLRKLSSLRGKVVLIDFWGTWCQPCIRELPFIDSLSATYSENELMIFGVALERKKVKPWTNFIRQRRLPGLQVYAESQASNEHVQQYNVSSVPRYVLIGRDGRIITADAPRPSSPRLRVLIEQALRAD